MNLFDGRLKARTPAPSQGLYVTGNCMLIDADPYAHALAQAESRLKAARLEHEAAGEHVDACSDEVARIRRMSRLHRQQAELPLLGESDA